MSNNRTNSGSSVEEKLWLLATAVRDEVFAAAVSAYEDARMDGLCHEGAWECAQGAMRVINMDSIVSEVIAEQVQNS